MKTDTTTLIKAMRVLAQDIQSGDGVANAAIAEAADRLEILLDALKSLNDVETGAYMEHASQWKAWGEAKEKAKRAIETCEGGE